MPITEAYEGEYGWIVYSYKDEKDQMHDCVCGSKQHCSLVMQGNVEIDRP